MRYVFLLLAAFVLCPAGPAAAQTVPLSEWEKTRQYDRQIFLRNRWKEAIGTATTNHAKAVNLTKYIQSRFYHPAISVAQPLWPDGSVLSDPIVLWNYKHRAYCGHVAMFVVDLVTANGWKGRVVQLHGHVAAEIFYDNAWHFVDGDALDGGAYIKNAAGKIASVAEIVANPALADQVRVTNENFKTYPWITDSKQSYYSVPYRGLFARLKYGLGTIPYALVKTATAQQEISNHRYGWNYRAVVDPWP